MFINKREGSFTRITTVMDLSFTPRRCSKTLNRNQNMVMVLTVFVFLREGVGRIIIKSKMYVWRN